jgi:hypothetical protein
MKFVIACVVQELVTSLAVFFEALGSPCPSTFSRPPGDNEQSGVTPRESLCWFKAGQYALHMARHRGRQPNAPQNSSLRLLSVSYPRYWFLGNF